MPRDGTHALLPQPTPNFSKDISGGDAFDPTGREFRGMSAWGRSQMKDFTVYHPLCSCSWMTGLGSVSWWTGAFGSVGTAMSRTTHSPWPDNVRRAT